MKSKKKKLWKFPNISRFFTETKGKLSWDEKKYFIYLFILIFIFFIAFMVIDLKQKIVMTQAMVVGKEQIKTDIKKWEIIVDKYKDYRDGYLQLTVLEYKVGDTKKAREYLDKALTIDPNSKEGRELEKILSGNP